jgi:hypothetical protein
MPFLFADIKYEISVLGEFLETLEKQLHYLHEQAAIQRDAKLRKTKNDVDRIIERDEFWEKTENVLPRFFRGPFLVSLWAVYESGVYEIANDKRKEQGIGLKLQDIKGSFPENAKKYFKHVLKTPLCNDNTLWQELMRLSDLRNLLAHGNGKLESIKNIKDWKKFYKWEDDNIGITFYMGLLILSKDFLQRSYDNVKQSLEDLMT